MSTNGNGHAVELEAKDAGPVIRFPYADFWPTNNHQGTVETKALGVNWFAASWLAYSCMRYRATKLIEPPLWVTVEEDGEETFLDGGHPIEELLQRPNPDMTLSDLLELTSLYLDSTPGCVWHKVRGRGGRTERLYPYSGDEFTVESAKGDDGTNRIFGRYRITAHGGRAFDATPDDVVHFRNANPGDLHASLPPLTAALARLGIERELIRGIQHGLRNAIRPGSSIRFPDGTVLTPGPGGQLEEYKAFLQAQFEGATNRGKPIVTGNATYETHDMSFDGLSGGVLTEENEVAVCSCFQLHPAIVGTRVGLINSSDKHNMDAVVGMFYDNAVLPTWTRWEDTLTVSLLQEFDADSRHFLRFDKTRVRALQEDVADKAAVVVQLRDELDLDERRALLGYAAATPEQREEIEAARASGNPFADFGKALVSKALPVQVQTKASRRGMLWALRDANVRGQQFAWELAARAQLEDDKAAVLKLAGEILETAKSLGEREAAARWVHNIDSKGPPFGADPDSVKKLIRALTEALDLESAWLPRVTPLTAGTAKRAAEAAAGEVGLSFDVLQPGLTKYVERHAAQLVTEISDTTRNRIKDALLAGLEEGEGIPELTKRIEESGAFSASRAELIARTEVTTTSNHAGVESLSHWADENEAVVFKGWLATQDARTREEHAAMDGEEVGIKDAFSNGLKAPGEPNCRCSLTYRIAED